MAKKTSITLLVIGIILFIGLVSFRSRTEKPSLPAQQSLNEESLPYTPLKNDDQSGQIDAILPQKSIATTSSPPIENPRNQQTSHHTTGPILSYKKSYKGHVQPKSKWNMDEYKYDDNYYNTVNPGRIHQTRPLKEGEVLPKIKTVSPGFQWALADSLCEHPLRVKISPNMPCTFYAEDWGTFSNGENSITVKSDDEGIATALYTTPSSKGGSMVLAHSPEAMGIARFSIKVVSEEELKEINNKLDINSD